jgi:enoyl-CoA hydratase
MEEWTGFETMRFERDGDVLTITIDHPESDMNAVDGRLHREFGEVFRRLKQGDPARAAVLTGQGRAFSAGGDMTWFPTLRDPDRLHELRREAKQIVWDQLDVEIPIVCALNGPAVGLGASIALLCDVVVMSERAVIIDPHVQVGLVAGDGGAAIWPLLVGPLAAKRHLMLGEPMTAEDALRLGVASEVCPPDEIDATARAWGERLAAQAPLALQGTKLAVNAQLKQALLTSFDLSTALEMPCFLSADHAEAVAAFVEKRTPTFEGR